MGFGKHKHTGMDKTISGGGGYEGIYFSQGTVGGLASSRPAYGSILLWPASDSCAN